MTDAQIQEQNISIWQQIDEKFYRTDQCEFCREDKFGLKEELKNIEDTP